MINQNRPDHVKWWREFVFLPRVFEALALLAGSPYRVVVVTNQSAVGRGLITPERLEDLHDRMIAEVARRGGRIDAVYACPHRPEERCTCRKPRPGLYLRAAQELEIDLPHSLAVGDAVSDVEATLAAGCQPVLVRSGRGREQLKKMPDHLARKCYIEEDLFSVVDRLARNGYSWNYAAIFSSSGNGPG